VRRPGLICSLLAFVVSGCFRLQPVATGAAPETGSSVALYLNDAGRLALGPSVGPEIDRLEGRLVELDNEGYLIAVQHVYALRGGVQIWSGEQVRVGKDHVRSVSERRLSKVRTVALGAAGAGSLTYMLSRGLFGFGLDDPSTPTDTTAESLRLIWP
jgi:hypothetical protein